jgi:hypothetical protein
MEPLTWAYLALLAASTAANAKAQHKTNKARAKVASEERERRSDQQRKAEASAQDTANALVGMKNKERERAAELEATYRQEAPAATTTDAGTRYLSTDAPRQATETIQNIDRARAEAATEANARSKTLANLGAFGDVFQQGMIRAAGNQQDIGMQQGFMEGWQRNVLPQLYMKANTAGRDWATAADIMKLAATVMSFGAMAGGSAASAGAEGAETATVLDKMQGVPSQFAGKDLFGMGATSGSFAPLSGMETASIGDAASRLSQIDFVEGIGGGTLRQTSNPLLNMNRFGRTYDPYWFLPPGSRRLRTSPAYGGY